VCCVLSECGVLFVYFCRIIVPHQPCKAPFAVQFYNNNNNNNNTKVPHNDQVNSSDFPLRRVMSCKVRVRWTLETQHSNLSRFSFHIENILNMRHVIYSCVLFFYSSRRFTLNSSIMLYSRLGLLRTNTEYVVCKLSSIFQCKRATPNITEMS
jgi:hypothetical protein